MSWIDWTILIVYYALVVAFGIFKGLQGKGLDGYFRGNRSVSWWVVGLSVMATQASAITFIGDRAWPAREGHSSTASSPVAGNGRGVARTAAARRSWEVRTKKAVVDFVDFKVAPDPLNLEVAPRPLPSVWHQE